MAATYFDAYSTPQIQFSAGECFLHASKWHGQVADIPEAFSTQQLVRDILRS
jgi:hypothetical protein